MKNTIKTIVVLLIIGMSFTACTKEEVQPSPISFPYPPSHQADSVQVDDILGEWDISGNRNCSWAFFMTGRVENKENGIDGVESEYSFYIYDYDIMPSIVITDTYQLDANTVVMTWYEGCTNSGQGGLNTTPNFAILTKTSRGLKRIEFTRQDGTSVVALERI